MDSYKINLFTLQNRLLAELVVVSLSQQNPPIWLCRRKTVNEIEGKKESKFHLLSFGGSKFFNKNFDCD